MDSSKRKEMKKDKPRSAVVQQLIHEKNRGKREKEEAENRLRIENERKQRFRIPKKKKPEDPPPPVADDAEDSVDDLQDKTNKTKSFHKKSHSSDKSHDKKHSSGDNNSISLKDNHRPHSSGDKNSISLKDNHRPHSSGDKNSISLKDNHRSHSSSQSSKESHKSDSRKSSHNKDHSHSVNSSKEKSHTSHKDNNSNILKSPNSDRSQPWDMSAILADSVNGEKDTKNPDMGKNDNPNSKHKHTTDHSSSGDKDRKHSSSKHKHKSHAHDSETASSTNTHRSEGSSKDSKDKHASKSSSHSSSEKSKHSSSKSHSSSSKSSPHSSKSSSSKSHSSSSISKSSSSKSHGHSSSSRHSSSSKSKSSSSVSDKNKKSSSKHPTNGKDIDIADLRAQVKNMKQDLEYTEAVSNVTTVTSSSNAGFRFQECVDGKVLDTHENMMVPLKNRQGIDDECVDDKKIKILTKTQLILQRTKEKLAKEREMSQARTRGKRTGTGTVRAEKDDEKANSKIKSRSIIKDGFDSDSDEVEGLEGFENSFSEDLVKPEPGAILKNIKRKIDEKLSNYNFPEPALKEKRERVKRNPNSEKNSKLKQIRDKYTKIKEAKRDRHKRDREKSYVHENEKEDSFPAQNKPKPFKKPVIVRRAQYQPPPMNFSDLMKIAEVKSHQKIEPEPIIPVIKKKKPEERPMTGEEKERQQRAEESRKRRKEEDLAFYKNLKNESPILHKSLTDKHESDKSATKSSIHKPSDNDKLMKGGASSAKGRSNSPMLKPGLNKPISSQSTSGKSGGTKNSMNRYDSEHENVLVCGPSPSKPSQRSERPSQRSERPSDQGNQATNPWDRIYGQIQKKNPPKSLPMKRKHQVLLESDENEDEYDEEDDFIDDDNAGEDYSAHIRNIFGYDKRKYRHEDEDDVDNMEANFSTIMKEEARSAKLGLQEDLEDMRQEQEELRLKKLAKKKMRR